MHKRIITTFALSLGMSLGLVSGFGGIAAQSRGAPVIQGNTVGTCATTPTSGNAGGWTITCGDLSPGSGLMVVGPPSATTAPAPVAAPAPAPAPAETAPVESAPAPAPATAGDLDGDNIADELEPALGLDPTNPDTDGDGLADGDEINIYGTDPLNWDTDGDGLGDGEEIFATNTDPLVWNEGATANSQSLAQQAASPPSDNLQQSESVALEQETTEVLTADDGNASARGLGDAEASPGSVTRGGVLVPTSSGTALLGPDGAYRVTETTPPVVNVSGATSQPPSVVPAAPAGSAPSAPVSTGTTTTAPAPAPADTTTTVATEGDADGDNYPDALEWEMGLDANNPDSDGDGVADGDEITIYGTDPFAWDTDGDGLGDGEELFATNTDPLAWNAPPESGAAG